MAGSTKKEKPVTTGIEELIEAYVNQVFNPEDMIQAIREISGDIVTKSLENYKIPTTSNSSIEIKQGKKIVATVDSVPAEFTSCLQYAANGVNLLLTGPAGTGKGYTAEKIAEALKADFFEVPAMQHQHEWEGFMDANSRYVETALYRACKNAAAGKKTVLLLDELDCCDPGELKHFNDFLERKWYIFPNGEKLEFSENLVIVGAANTWGTGADSQYIGNQLDASTLDRFVTKSINYDRQVELSITGNNIDLVDFFHQLRKSAANCHMNFIASYRSLKRISKMENVLPLQEVLKECLFKSLTSDDIEILLNGCAQGNKYVRAAQGKGKAEKAA